MDKYIYTYVNSDLTDSDLVIDSKLHILSYRL